MRILAYSVGVSLETSSSAWFEVERGVCGVGDAVFYTSAVVIREMDTVLFMSFFLMFNVCSITRSFGKRSIDFRISLL